MLIKSQVIQKFEKIYWRWNLIFKNNVVKFRKTSYKVEKISGQEYLCKCVKSRTTCKYLKSMKWHKYLVKGWLKGKINGATNFLWLFKSTAVAIYAWKHPNSNLCIVPLILWQSFPGWNTSLKNKMQFIREFMVLSYKTQLKLFLEFHLIEK